MRAYDEIYLDDAMTNLGVMLDCSSIAYDGEIGEFFEAFIASEAAAGFEIGDPQYIAGLSGIELAETIIEDRRKISGNAGYMLQERSQFYWAGWALAYLQWFTNYSFKKLHKCGITLNQLLGMYPKFHEADISKFTESALAIINGNLQELKNGLKRQRKLLGLTQNELAQLSGVSLRMIRAYEQGEQDLGRAEARTLLNLADVLKCKPQALLG